MNYLLMFGPATLVLVVNICGIFWLRRQYATFKEVVFAIRSFRRFAKSMNFGARHFNNVGISADQAAQALDKFRKAFSDFESFTSHISKKPRSQITPK